MASTHTIKQQSTNNNSPNQAQYHSEIKPNISDVFQIRQK